MESSNSLELDDAIFPQPPHNVSTLGNIVHGGTIMRDTSMPMIKPLNENQIDTLSEKKEYHSSSENDISLGEDISERTLKSEEKSRCNGCPQPSPNKTAITRIIRKVQSKANKMWEHIGHTISGRHNNNNKDTMDESSRESSLSLSDIKASSSFGDRGDLTDEDSNENTSGKDYHENNTKTNAREVCSNVQQPASKSNTLKRLASGIKSGFIQTIQKNKN